jgi:hypothetical protein
VVVFVGVLFKTKLNLESKKAKLSLQLTGADQNALRAWLTD